MRWSIVIMLVTAALVLLGDVTLSLADSVSRDEPLLIMDEPRTFGHPLGERVLCEMVREVKAATGVALYDTLAAHLADPQVVAAFAPVRAVRGVGKDLVDSAFAERVRMLRPLIRLGNLEHPLWQYMAQHEDVFSAPLYRDLSGKRDLAGVQAALREERAARERLHEALDRMVRDLVLEGEGKRPEAGVDKDPCKVGLEGEELR